MNFKKVKNKLGIIKENISLETFSIIESDNEKDIESHFKEYIESIGWKQNVNYTRDKDIKNRYKFRNDKKGCLDGEPDYIFYNEENTIIAICDVKSTKVGANNGIDDAKEYIRCVNEDFGLDIKCALGFDGKTLLIEYNNEGTWEQVCVESKEINQMPDYEFLSFIIESENKIEEFKETDNIGRNKLERFFKKCDDIIRTSSIGSSPTEKFVELSTIIFIKMFALKGYDKEFLNQKENRLIKKTFNNVWEIIVAGEVDIINTQFASWLNTSYKNLYMDANPTLIRIDTDKLKEIAKMVDRIFSTYELTDFTNVKGDILEFFQSDSKDRKLGEFFTPRHIIKYMVNLVNPTVVKRDKEIYIEKIYDPTCGTGGFLIEVFNRYRDYYFKEIQDLSLLKENVLHGTELKGNTALLAKLNMILIGDGHNNIVNANAFSYDKIENLSKKKDVFGHYIPVPESDVDYYMEGTEKKYFIKGNRERKVSCESSKKTDYLYDDFGEKIEVQEDEIITRDRKKFSSDGYIVGKYKGKYYKKIQVKHYELKNEDDEEKIKYTYKNVKSVNPLLNIKEIDGEDNPIYQKNFGDFDIVLANQPFGLSEPNKADYLFIDHMLESLHKGKREITGRYGRIACIVDNGFLHDSKYLEQRKELQENSTIKAIISLPQKTFAPYVKIIKSNILLIEKRKPRKNEKTYFVKITNDGYSQDDKRSRQIDKDDFKELLQLWRKWEDDESINYETNEIIYESSHREKEGFAELHELNPESWAVNFYMKYKIPSFNFEGVKLYDYIEECTEKKHPKELAKNKDDIIEIVGVSKKYGIISSDKKSADEYKQKYKVIRDNQIAYNPSRVNIGSISLYKGDESLISPSYTIFKVREEYKNKLMPEYIMYFLKSKYGKNQIESYNFGTVRNSLSFDDLGEIMIPNMPIEEQQRLIILLSNISDSKHKICDTYNSLLKLGIFRSSFYKFDCEFDEVKLEDIIIDDNTPSYGISEASDNSSDGYPILKMNNVLPIINAEDLIDDIDTIQLSEVEAAKYKIRDNDILINRTNSLDLVGKTGIFKYNGYDSKKTYVYASYLMKITLKAKTIANKTSFPLSNIKDYQYDLIKEISQYANNVFFIIEFREFKEVNN